DGHRRRLAVGRGTELRLRRGSSRSGTRAPWSTPSSETGDLMTAVTTVLPISPQGSPASATAPLPLVRSEVRMDPVVSQGPALLAGITAGPGLEAHRHPVPAGVPPPAGRVPRRDQAGRGAPSQGRGGGQRRRGRAGQPQGRRAHGFGASRGPGRGGGRGPWPGYPRGARRGALRAAVGAGRGRRGAAGARARR